MGCPVFLKSFKDAIIYKVQYYIDYIIHLFQFWFWTFSKFLSVVSNCRAAWFELILIWFQDSGEHTDSDSGISDTENVGSPCSSTDHPASPAPEVLIITFTLCRGVKSSLSPPQRKFIKYVWEEYQVLKRGMEYSGCGEEYYVGKGKQYHLPFNIKAAGKYIYQVGKKGRGRKISLTPIFYFFKVNAWRKGL